MSTHGCAADDGVQQVQQPHLLPFVILVFLEPDMSAAFSLLRQGSSMLPTLVPPVPSLTETAPFTQATSGNFLRTIHFATSLMFYPHFVSQ
jgi:hypothetical protein